MARLTRDFECRLWNSDEGSEQYLRVACRGEFGQRGMRTIVVSKREAADDIAVLVLVFAKQPGVSASDLQGKSYVVGRRGLAAP